MRRWPGLVAWVVAWVAVVALDGTLDLANQALLLVLAAAVAALWWGPWLSVAASALAVLAFNVAFVPPRGALTVDLRQHVLLLLTTLAVGSLVAWLMARQRRLAADERRQVQRLLQLRELGDALRAADDPRTELPRLRQALDGLAGAPTALLVASAPRRGLAGPGTGDRREADASAGELHGPPTLTADERAGLRVCLAEGRAMGPGTGRHEEQGAWYLPLRGRQGAYGAAWLPAATGGATDGATRGATRGAIGGATCGATGGVTGGAKGLAAGDIGHELRLHAQALCDLMGATLERAEALRAAAEAREAAQAQALRNTLLTAISHDHRTPLAVILGAAGALHDQDARLAAEQRRRLAGTIVEEASRLARLTDNLLQLARLESGGGAALRLEWESAEEIVGTVLRRARQRLPPSRVKARVEPGLPLLRCDAVLLVQLLDNLVDNALKYGGGEVPVEVPVEVLARRIGDDIVLAVRDRGPGVPLAQRQAIFELFRRGGAALPGASVGASAGVGAGEAPRGAGVGLALCRVIARAHGGELRLRARAHGGSSFELVLPVPVAPGAAAESEAGASEAASARTECEEPATATANAARLPAGGPETG